MNRFALAALALIPLVTAGCPECPYGDCAVEPVKDLRLDDGSYDLTLGMILDNSCDLVGLESERVVVPAWYRADRDRFLLEVDGIDIKGEVADGWLGGEGKVRYDEAEPAHDTGVAVEDDDEDSWGDDDGEGAPPPCEVVEEEEDEERDDERDDRFSSIEIDMEILNRGKAGGTLSMHLSEADFGQACTIVWDAALDASERGDDDRPRDDEEPVEIAECG